MSSDEIITVRQAASLLGISIRETEEWINGGAIQSMSTASGYLRVRKSDVLAASGDLRLKSQIVYNVESCGDCPMSWDGTELGDAWRCTAADLGSEYRELGRNDRGFDAWRSRPDWCPLRERTILVQLAGHRPEPRTSGERCSKCDIARPRGKMWFKNPNSVEPEVWCPACAPPEMVAARRTARSDRLMSQQRNLKYASRSEVKAHILAVVAERGTVETPDLMEAVRERMAGKAASEYAIRLVLKRLSSDRSIVFRTRRQGAPVGWHIPQETV